MAAKAQPKSKPVVGPNLGLYFDRAPIALTPQMLQDGNNFRVAQGKLNNLNIGWIAYDGFATVPNGGNALVLKSQTLSNPGVQVAQPVTLINTFSTRGAGDILILGTPTDLYVYNPTGGGAGAQTVRYITPIYRTGTASASGTAVTGTGTFWKTAANVGNPGIKAGDEISFGSNAQNDPAATWFLISTVNTDTSITLAQTAGTVANGNYTIRRKFTGDTTNIWVTDQMLSATDNAGAIVEDRWYATNGIDPVVRWNGNTGNNPNLVASTLNGGFDFNGNATSQFSPGGNTLIFKTLRQYGANLMTYANGVQGGSQNIALFYSSDAGKPEQLTGGVAFTTSVHRRADPIVRMEPLGDYLAIYSTKGITMALFVGSPTMYTFREVVRGKGPLGNRTVARFPAYHEFLASDSQYAFDGATVKEINKHVWRRVLNTQDPVRTIFTNSHFDEANGEVLWVLPLTSDPGAGSGTITQQKQVAPSSAMVEHYLEDVTGNQQPSASISLQRPQSRRSFPFYSTGYTTRNSSITWDKLTQAWNQYNFRWNDQFFFTAFPLNLGGGSDGRVYNFAAAQDADGAALSSFVTFGRRATWDGRVRALVKRVYPFVENFTTALNVTVLMADTAMGPTSITQTNSFSQTFTDPDHYFTTPYRRGRYVSVQFGTTGPSQPWQLSGYDIDVHSGGKR